MMPNDPWLADRIDDLKASLVFLTRLPLAASAGTGIARACWAFPIAGMIVGLVAAAVYALAHRLGLPAWPAAALSVAATLAATGCLHEDGLADTADGFGGGKTRDSKLAIMRDSRIGTYGVCALAIGLLLRVSAVASLADTALVVPALLAAHGAARAMLPVFMYFMPPARDDGLSFNAGSPPREGVAVAAVLGILLLVFCLGPVLGIVALILIIAVAALVAWLSLVQIDGQTGDVLGALEQACEIVILLVALR
jgi:adenosylcobinamide-GDP ribazoletransferase